MSDLTFMYLRIFCSLKLQVSSGYAVTAAVQFCYGMCGTVNHFSFLRLLLNELESPLQKFWSLGNKSRLCTGSSTFLKYLKACDWIMSPLSSCTATEVSVMKVFAVTWCCFCVSSMKGMGSLIFFKDRWQNIDAEFNSRETGKYVHHFNACKLQ